MMSRSPRQLLAALCLIALVVLRAEPRLMRLPFGGRAKLTRGFAGYADRTWPQYPRFLEGVLAHTTPGDRVAIVVPAMRWDGGYSYAYYRASYFLPGRIVLPLVDPQDRMHPENFQAATCVAAWRSNFPQTRSRVAWSGEGGVLLRR